jgi:hypothetical protein
MGVSHFFYCIGFFPFVIKERFLPSIGGAEVISHKKISIGVGLG